MTFDPLVLSICIHCCDNPPITNDDAQGFFAFCQADVLFAHSSRSHQFDAPSAEEIAAGMIRGWTLLGVLQKGVHLLLDASLLVAFIGNVCCQFEFSAHNILSSMTHDLRWFKKICLFRVFSNTRPFRTTIPTPWQSSRKPKSYVRRGVTALHAKAAHSVFIFEVPNFSQSSNIII